MQTISLEDAIQALRARRGEMPKDSAVLQKHMLRLLAQGQPVTAEALAEATRFPLEMVQDAYLWGLKSRSETKKPR